MGENKRASCLTCILHIVPRKNIYKYNKIIRNLTVVLKKYLHLQHNGCQWWNTKAWVHSGASSEILTLQFIRRFNGVRIDQLFLFRVVFSYYLLSFRLFFLLAISLSVLLRFVIISFFLYFPCIFKLSFGAFRFLHANICMLWFHYI